VGSSPWCCHSFQIWSVCVQVFVYVRTWLLCVSPNVTNWNLWIWIQPCNGNVCMHIFRNVYMHTYTHQNNVCIHIYIYTHVYLYINKYLNIRKNRYMYIGTYISMITYFYIFIYIYVWSRFTEDCGKFVPRTHRQLHGYVHIYAYVYMKIYAYIYKYIYIYIYWDVCMYI